MAIWEESIMDSVTLITMLLTLGIVWGGFACVFVLALRRERKKRNGEIE
jgi:hypothetical protein